MRELTRPMRVLQRIPPQGTIGHPERFRPEPRLVAMPGLRVLADGFGEMQIGGGRWERIHPMFVELLRALEAGERFADYGPRAAKLGPKHTPELREAAALALCRRFLLKLWYRKVIEIPFEAPPAVFRGRYEWVKELGRGGIGVVHLCRDRADGGRLVTVKHPWGFRQAIERTDRSLRKEATVLQAFDHPQIIRFLGAWEDDGLLHVVREYVAGEGLKRACRRADGTDDRRLRVEVAKGVARVVKHMHDSGYLFLDIGPGNFILQEGTDVPVLIDIGLTRPHENGACRIDYPIGTAGYASPEVVKRVGATFRSDVFGFGRLYWALLAGSNPPKNSTLSNLVPVLQERGVDADEIAFVTRCSADRPEDRLPDMDAVLRELERL